MKRELTENKIAEGIVFLCLLALATVVFMDIGGDLPERPEPPKGASLASAELPLKAAQTLFDMESYGELVVTTNSSNPFYTEYFVPVKPPPPAPPLTRKVSVLYQGFYATQDGRKKAFLTIDGAPVKMSLGETSKDGLMLGVIERKEVHFVDASTKEHIVKFKEPALIEVPNK